MNKYSHPSSCGPWNPFDFFWEFWREASVMNCIWCVGASNYADDDVNLYLMGGEL